MTSVIIIIIIIVIIIVIIISWFVWSLLTTGYVRCDMVDFSKIVLLFI